MSMLIVLWLTVVFCFMAHAVPLVETFPRQRWWFDVLDWLLRPIMKLFFRGKLTHAWHWIEYYGVVTDSEVVDVQGDPNAPVVTGWLTQLWAECTCNPRRWQVTAAVTVDHAHPLGAPAPDKFWLVGFKSLVSREKRICTVLLSRDHDRIVRLYVGRQPVRFFAANRAERQLPLMRSSHTDSSCKLL